MADIDPRIAELLEAGARSESFRAAMERGESYWDTDGLQVGFEVHAFQSPFVLVTRRSDGVKGTLRFVHRPRYYYGFEPA